MNAALLQFTRFAAVGVTANFILYVLYLLLTSFGLEYVLAMTILYVTGVCYTFFFNKKWTFEKNTRITAEFLRYLMLYLVGYFINLSMLILFVHYLGFGHQIVQGIMVIILAGLFFIAQKYWVFR